MLLQKRLYCFKEGIHICTDQRQKAEYQTELMVLFIILSGTAEVQFGSQKFDLENGSVLLITTQDKIEVRNTGGTELIYDLLFFSSFKLIGATEEELRYQQSSDFFPRQGLFYSHASIEVKSLAAQLISMSTKEAENSNGAYLLNELIAKVEAEFLSFQQRTLNSPFHSVLEYIHVHSHLALSRDTVAQYFGYHPNYFSGRFKKETGWSFSAYLAHIRMDKAKVFLLEHTLTIGEVARKVGYQDGLYLSRKFRQKTGMSPSEFRKERKFERIITLQFTGALLATGIKPAAVLPSYFNVPEFLEEEVSSSIQLSPDTLPTSEQWRKLKPDLIIAPTYLYQNQKVIEEMESIAPVMMLDWDTHDRLEEVQLIGRIVGREAQTNEWIRKFKEKAESARKMLKEVVEEGETFGLYELRWEGNVGIWKASARGAFNLYTMLKLTPAKRIQKEVLEPNKHLIISENELPAYAADHMFVVVHSMEQAKRICDLEIWRQLPAAKNRQIYLLRLEDFWASEGMALEKQMEIQVKYLLDR
ncbi:AraC family transcriptional regulator [Bacillus sp. SD075]|uniref:AraC family transcriptional regulator n=1 Tax=Bacillus sp. SD075 TaxID=2781732 RepID=UPI001A9755C1|nr:helix-turn-helix domain-containing protein [Bacillus sp. SD075]MBO0999727.1 AraC family transcriptional regulator [Bacillus sp. SD075]